MLIGDIGGMVRLGLEHALVGAGMHVLRNGPTPEAVVEWINEALPDVVLVDHDADGALDLARLLASRFPALKVIACSTASPTMRVFPPFHGGESYVSDLSPELLVDTIRTKG